MGCRPTSTVENVTRFVFFGDAKNAHLMNLENAAEKLKLFKADLMDFDSIRAAVKGCDGVFHVASPVELVEPALKGTLNVLKACSEEKKVRRVVIVSSVAAVMMNPNWPKDQLMDETCWSDAEYCKATNNWYCFSKTVAEAEAWEYAKKNGLDVVTVCPAFVLGPMLQHATNASSLALVKLLKGIYSYLQYILELFSFPIYKEGSDLAEMSSEKLQRLGWKYRTLKENSCGLIYVEILAKSSLARSPVHWMADSQT
ncbi:Cinnamoyl-CoA reductase 1 [Sesamum angolense]|uniref:Cinnamoyl-CoA reductase 1 n=1 Tax=Sesamum angolense TaxID=2727404 RepID=A0AAE1T626_9LAMI|nr:Cinnamoyl-CoA reductase 1 [Sesamum angolense]